MEQWEALVEACPSPVDLRYFHKAVQTAGVTLRGDLAHFETEWILQTLLQEPVGLLNLVRSKRADDAWFKVIGDAFKLLEETTGRHREQMERHFEEIVELCVLGFDAQTRKQALLCLTSIARRSALGAAHAHRHVASLEETATGRGPLALLIGTICEHHPETVENDVNRIWRIFLNLLDCNKNTDTLSYSLLGGVLGLLKHFGGDLPTAELTTFYDKFAVDFRGPRAQLVCLKILAEHSSLFRERISRDARMRNLLWSTLHGSSGTATDAIKATLSVYKNIFECLSKEQSERIASTELVPQTHSTRAHVKYTALRALAGWGGRGGGAGGGAGGVAGRGGGAGQGTGACAHPYALQFEMRGERVTYDVAEAVAWCIESAQPGSETLLQAAILFYSRLPAGKRKRVVVHGILNAMEALRTTAVIFLISESTQNESSLEVHLPLWKDLFDSEGGTDETVLDKSRYVFEDFMGYLVFVLEGFLEQEIEPPTRLQLLLQLTSLLLGCCRPDARSSDHSLALLPLLIDLIKRGGCAAAMRAARCACTHVADPRAHADLLSDFYQEIRIDRCKDEALLCESCLALVEAPHGSGAATEDVLTALQITFSRNDVEPQLLSKALLKLEDIMKLEKDNLNSNILNDILRHVQNIHNRKDLSGKDARVLRRDVLLFLGKYGREIEISINNMENVVIVKLMDSLTLNLPNPDEGTTYKINLRKMLHRALEYEDANSLQMLLTILCANLSRKRDSRIQEALSLVCVALCRAHARGSNPDPRALQAAVRMCDSVGCLQGMLQCIGEEKSPGVRKMLSDALEALLVHQVQDGEEALVNTVAEHAVLMMKSIPSTKKRAGLNVTETLISSLKEYHSLTKNLLPDLLVQIAKTFEIDSDTTFEIGSKLFLEKIELFDNNEIDKLLRDLLEVILIENKMADVNDKMAESEVRIFKITTKMIMDFMKCIIDYKKDDKKKICLMIFEIIDKENCDFEKTLYVLAKYKNVFEYVSDIQKDFVNKLMSIEIKMDEPYFCMEAVLVFLQEYVDALLELYYQETLQFLSKQITELSPSCVKYLHRNIKSCLSVYTRKRTPAILQRSLETWFSKLPILEITNSIEKESFTTEHSIIVFSLKVMLSYCDITTLTDVSNVVKKWSTILLKLFSNGYVTNYLRSKMSYLTDILVISVRFLKALDLKKLILEGSNIEVLPTENIGLQFCRFFMHVFYEVLLKKPYILLDADMNKCCVLLNDIVKFAVKKKCTDEQYDAVLELADKLWPIYEAETTFSQKHLVLLDLNNLPKKLGPESNPLQWAVNMVMHSEASDEDKAGLIGVLPGGENYSAAYRSFASCLPTRLSDMRGAAPACLRALLDALATSRDLTLLDIVITLASGEESPGWWDEALEACMASLAAGGALPLCRAAHERCGRSAAAACRRVLLPLLRYSTPSLNEEFFSTILDELMKPKEQKVVSTHRSYQRSIGDHTRMFMLLQVACEKISDASLESPNSTLYKGVVPKVTQSWYLIRMACKLCDKLKKKPLPEGADDKLKEDYRQFQCANYNCFVAAICRRRPDVEIYRRNLFDVAVWDSLVDPDKKYDLPIRPQWVKQKQRSTIPVAAGRGEHGSASGSTRSVRTRMFLRTLSESPMMYDLVEPETEEQSLPQEPELPESELNQHPCAGSLTALLRQAAAPPLAAGLLPPLAAGLLRCGRANWLLAQVICNCKEELKPYASELRPALLEVVATTAVICNCKEELKPYASDLRPALLEVVATTAVTNNGDKVLNGLHVDILEMLLEWGDSSPQPSATLDSVLSLVLTSARHHAKSVRSTLTNLAARLLDVYGSVVSLPSEVYEPYLTDNDTPKTLLIHIPTVLPTLLARLENKQDDQLPKIAEVIGLTLNKNRDKPQYLTRFHKLLEAVRRASGAKFVRLLFYAQAVCADCCDEHNFRMATSLAQKLVGQDRNKCLRVLANYIHHSTSDYIQEMFETVDLPELMSLGVVESFGVVAEGVKVMCESVKKRLVMVAAKYCDNSLVAVRKAAGEVMLNAFEDMFKSPEEPSSKRLKHSSSAIISRVLCNDVYASTVLSALACACVDASDDVSAELRHGVARLLDKNMAIRFVECFLLAVYLPTICYDGSRSLSVCVYALLDMLLLDLKGQDRFKSILLRDEPLELRSPIAGSSKLLTLSRSYQGTFRTLTSRTNAARFIATNENRPEIDVQISIEHILDTFMRFAKEVPEASEVLCLELVRALQPGFGLGAEMGAALAAILNKGVNDLTPFVVELCGVFVDDLCKVDGVQDTMKKLEAVTRSTEGEGIIRFLSQEVRLRSEGPEQFSRGIDRPEPPSEAVEDAQFSIEGLASAFGLLSNWDHLTIQQRDRIAATLPPLWTDQDTFTVQLQDYTGSVGWLGALSSAARGAGGGAAPRWLRAGGRWPKNALHNSAVTEAVLMLEGRSADGFPCDIRPRDCLAEWAARLMIRTAYQTSLSSSDSSEERSVLSRSHELKWCEIANERGLGAAVLQCVKRNTPYLSSPEEPTPWLLAALSARRGEARRRGEGASLRAWEAARKHVCGHAPSRVEQARLMMILQGDLQSLSRESIEEAFEMVGSLDAADLGRHRRTLRSIYEMAMAYYDDLWDTDAATASQQSALVSEMAEVLARTLNLGPFDQDLLAVVLSRLDHCTEPLDEQTANKLLQLVHSNLSSVDDFTIDYLLSSRAIPPASLSAHPLTNAREDEAVVKFKRCFELLCDPEYSLLEYCGELRTALSNGDEDQWANIFRRMKSKLFENPYAGPQYLLLNRYKAKLYEICDYDPSASWRSSSASSLVSTCRSLAPRARPAALLAPQLCPALSALQGCPPRLLGRDVAVAALHKQLTVLNSARRPVVFLITWSDGRRSRFLLKSGEPMRKDAAAMRVQDAMRRRGAQLKGYKVTPLSEDCGLIEFLEDHVTLRELIGPEILDAALEAVARPDDRELMLAPMQANLAQYRQLIGLVPNHLLRDALTRRSLTQQHRELMMNGFQDSLAAATIVTWILGVGDRHLENAMCSPAGRVCHVDWGGALAPREPPPARLTRNILAVCDYNVLEARLQQLLASLRESHKIFSAVIKVSFKWMDEPFHQQYPHIKAILSGGAVSVDRPGVEPAMADLLQAVRAPLDRKTNYTVAEQISCLLRHCTDPRIMCITRSGWEPWV